MNVVVIGGGPAGCAAAYTLRKQGHAVRLFEASGKVGGRTRQLHSYGCNLASGALFLMGGLYPRTSALLREMGRDRELVPWKGISQLLDKDGGRYPVRFVALQSYLRLPMLTLGDRLRLARAALALRFGRGADNAFDGGDLARFETGENLEEWSRRTVGDRAYEYIVRPIMDFLYAVPASWLSLPFPLAVIRHAHRMSLSVPPGGIGQVSEWFIEASPGVEVHCNSPVTAIRRDGQGYLVEAAGESCRADALVVATEAFVAADLLAGLIPESATEALRQAPYTDYAHVAVGYRKSPWPSFPADIVLPVGAGETRNVGALVLHGRRHPGSVPPGGEVAGVYFNTPPLAGMSDDDIRREAVEAARRAFGPAPEPDFIHLFRYERGLTIARPGHYQRMDSVHGQLPAGITLAGDYFSQAGVEAAVFSGEKAALDLCRAPAGARAPEPSVAGRSWQAAIPQSNKE